MINSTTILGQRYRLPPITPLMLIVELGIIVVAALIATSAYGDYSTATRLSGAEAEHGVSSAFTTEQNLREYGYIALWQPWLGMGEPMIDNPTTFMLNPVSTWPSLLFGGVIGPKVSIILTAILAGVGGWVLGRALGFGSVARLVLGLLCIGKGNMYAPLTVGHFHPATNQAYFPWITAGAVGIFWLRRRWPIVLTAVAFTLLFWSGLIWYVLPMLMTIGALAVTHLFYIKPADHQPRETAVDYHALKRLAIAGLLIVGLSAITLLPMWVNRNHFGQSSVTVDPQIDLRIIIEQYFNPSRDAYAPVLPPGEVDGYFSYILPPWFAVALVVLFIPVLWLNRAKVSPQWRLWVVAAFMIVFCTLWGAGLNPIIAWSYQTIPLMAQWRHVNRALAVASFWMAVVAAMGLDAFWRSFIVKPASDLGRSRTLRRAAALALTGLSLVAAVQVISGWKTVAPQPPDTPEDVCVSWLRAQNPGKQLAVWTVGYAGINTYLRNHVRHYRVAVDFYHPQPDPPTLFNANLLDVSLPEYAIGFGTEPGWIKSLGYVEMPGAPSPYHDGISCLYHRTGALSYAYSIPLPELQKLTDTLPASATTPITAIERLPDRIALLVDADANQPLVVTLQEVAYPGWTVEIDGLPAKLESVGGQIGVVLPPGSGTRAVYFQYAPPLLRVGSVVTLVTWAFCSLYLLRADRFIPALWRQRAEAASARVVAFLLDPSALQTDDDLPPDVIGPPRNLPAPAIGPHDNGAHDPVPGTENERSP